MHAFSRRALSWARKKNTKTKGFMYLIQQTSYTILSILGLGSTEFTVGEVYKWKHEGRISPVVIHALCCCF